MNLASERLEDKSLLAANAEKDRGCGMITSFDIQNFRCFERLSLKDLSTINVIVGDNGSGKTAVLEAIYLAVLAHPRGATIARTIRNRSLPQGSIFWSRELFRSLWDDLFFDFNLSKTITARYTDSLAGNYTVNMELSEPKTVPAFPAGEPIPQLVFTRSGPHHSTISVLRIDEQGNPVLEGAPEAVPPVYILPSTSQFYSLDMADQFSSLSKRNLEHIIIKAMTKHFDQILHIAPEKDGDVFVLWVTTKPVGSRKKPLSVFSAGAARCLHILLSIVVGQNAVVLVDEIENGIYWRKMGGIWQTLREFCVERDMQLFATTHSYECLQSLIPAIEGHETDFSLIRTVVADGKASVTQFAGGPFLAALKGRGEIR